MKIKYKSSTINHYIDYNHTLNTNQLISHRKQYSAELQKNAKYLCNSF